MSTATLRLLALACSLTVTAALAAPAAPAAGPPAPSAVTIAPYVKGLFGYVTSKAGSRCAAGRRVEVFARADPDSKAPDRRLGTAVARRVEERSPSARADYMWRLTKRRPGRFYARVTPKQGCAGAKSATVEGLGGPHGDGAGDPPIPPCPSAGRWCRLDELHFDTGICPSFTAYAAVCGGSITGPAEWRTGGGHFDWSFVQGSYRKVILYGTSYRDYREIEWRLLGYMGGPERAEWVIEDGFNQRGAFADSHWYTPEAAGKAGSLGGPLYLDFQNGIIGADVYVHGYLFRR